MRRFLSSKILTKHISFQNILVFTISSFVLDTRKKKCYDLIGPNEFEKFPPGEQMFMRQKVIKLGYHLCDDVTVNHNDRFCVQKMDSEQLFTRVIVYLCISKYN